MYGYKTLYLDIDTLPLGTQHAKTGDTARGYTIFLTKDGNVLKNEEYKVNIAVKRPDNTVIKAVGQQSETGAHTIEVPNEALEVEGLASLEFVIEKQDKQVASRTVKYIIEKSVDYVDPKIPPENFRIIGTNGSVTVNEETNTFFVGETNTGILAGAYILLTIDEYQKLKEENALSNRYTYHIEGDN